VFFAYCVVTVNANDGDNSDSEHTGNGESRQGLDGEVHLFLSGQERVHTAGQHLAAGKGESVQIKPYGDIVKFLDNYVASNEERKVAFSSKTPQALAAIVPRRQCVEVGASPVAVMKCIKNEVELEGFRQCHIRDGAALCSFFAWLEKHVAGGDIDEVSAADKLEEMRSTKKHFVGLSFPTISGSGPNGAVIHYRPEKGSCRKITTEEVYLVDSGAQYKVNISLSLKGEG
jgi:Xaa-Pro aminopeptidase